ncbi:unnamed protein product, partial [Allacma fusca]
AILIAAAASKVQSTGF